MSQHSIVGAGNCDEIPIAPGSPRRPSASAAVRSSAASPEASSFRSGACAGCRATTLPNARQPGEPSHSDPRARAAPPHALWSPSILVNAQTAFSRAVTEADVRKVAATSATAAAPRTPSCSIARDRTAVRSSSKSATSRPDGSVLQASFVPRGSAIVRRPSSSRGRWRRARRLRPATSDNRACTRHRCRPRAGCRPRLDHVGRMEVAAGRDQEVHSRLTKVAPARLEHVARHLPQAEHRREEVVAIRLAEHRRRIPGQPGRHCRTELRHHRHQVPGPGMPVDDRARLAVRRRRSHE